MGARRLLRGQRHSDGGTPACIARHGVGTNVCSLSITGHSLSVTRCSSVPPGLVWCHRVQFGHRWAPFGVTGQGWCLWVRFGWCRQDSLVSPGTVQCHPQPSVLGTPQDRPLPMPTPPLLCPTPPGIAHPMRLTAQCWRCPPTHNPTVHPLPAHTNRSPHCSPRFSNVPSPVPSSRPVELRIAPGVPARAGLSPGDGGTHRAGGLQPSCGLRPWHSSHPMQPWSPLGIVYARCWHWAPAVLLCGAEQCRAQPSATEWTPSRGTVGTGKLRHGGAEPGWCTVGFVAVASIPCRACRRCRDAAGGSLTPGPPVLARQRLHSPCCCARPSRPTARP